MRAARALFGSHGGGMTRSPVIHVKGGNPRITGGRGKLSSHEIRSTRLYTNRTTLLKTLITVIVDSNGCRANKFTIFLAFFTGVFSYVFSLLKDLQASPCP